MAHGLEGEYNIVVSSRTPSQTNPPTILEIGEVKATGSISWAEELNGDGEASFSVEPETLNSDIASRWRNLRKFPCEIDIFRKGNRVYKGTQLSCQLQGPTLTINSRGLPYYFRYMYVESDLSFNSADVYAVAAGLVDHYQGLDYGDYGIDTSAIGTSGNTITRNYPWKERHQISSRILELAESNNGFDFYINFDRELVLVDEKGADKTGTVFADDTNITDPNVFWSVADGDIAGKVAAIGSSDDINNLPSGTVSNTTFFSEFGRVTLVFSIDGVTTGATLLDHATKAQTSRQEQVLLPSPAVTPIRDVEPGDFEAGDLVTYAPKIGAIGELNEQRRLRMIRTSVDEEGAETMSWELL